MCVSQRQRQKQQQQHRELSSGPWETAEGQVPLPAGRGGSPCRPYFVYRPSAASLAGVTSGASLRMERQCFTGRRRQVPVHLPRSAGLSSQVYHRLGFERSLPEGASAPLMLAPGRDVWSRYAPCFSDPICSQTLHLEKKLLYCRENLLLKPLQEKLLNKYHETTVSVRAGSGERSHTVIGTGEFDIEDCERRLGGLRRNAGPQL